MTPVGSLVVGVVTAVGVFLVVAVMPTLLTRATKPNAEGFTVALLAYLGLVLAFVTVYSHLWGACS